MEKIRNTIEKRVKVWYNVTVKLYPKAYAPPPRGIADAFNERKVNSLSKEAISRVLAAEAQANAIREDAEAQARARVEAAEASCAAEQTAALERASDELDARLDMVRERAVILIMQSREEAETDIESIKSAARDKMREAVKHIEWELCDV